MASQNDDHVKQPGESNHPTTVSITNDESATLGSPSETKPLTQWPPQSLPPQVHYPPEILPPNAQFPGYAPPLGIRYGQGYIPPQPPGRCSGCCRCFLICLILLVVVSIIAKVIVWTVIFITFLPRFPAFYVENVTLSNFNASTNPMTAKWNTTLRIENPNTELDVYFDRVESLMNYNYKYDVGFCWINPMFMEKKAEKVVQVEIATGKSAHFAVPIWIAQDMENDHKHGSINFIMKFKVWVTLKSNVSKWFKRELKLNVECDDLKVNFEDPSKDGILESKKRDWCDVTI